MIVRTGPPAADCAPGLSGCQHCPRGEVFLAGLERACYDLRVVKTIVLYYGDNRDILRNFLEM